MLYYRIDAIAYIHLFSIIYGFMLVKKGERMPIGIYSLAGRRWGCRGAVGAEGTDGGAVIGQLTQPFAYIALPYTRAADA